MMVLEKEREQYGMTMMTMLTHQKQVTAYFNTSTRLKRMSRQYHYGLMPDSINTRSRLKRSRCRRSWQIIKE